MSQAGRLDHVHGWRGIATLAVVFQHAAQLVREAGHPLFNPLLYAINLGRFGVVTFFLLSGFVIRFSFRGETPLRSFAIGRFFRLYPAYWVSLPVLSWVAWVKGFPPDFKTILVNATMLQGFFGVYNIGPGYWTLYYEVSFYLFGVVLFLMGTLRDPRFGGPFALLALGLTLLPFATGAPISELPFFYALFLIGNLLHDAFVADSAVAKRWVAVLVPLAMAVGVVMGGVFVPVPNNANVYFKPLALASSMSVPIAVFVLVLWLKPAMGRTALYLGTISYSVYLFQDIGLHTLPRLISPRDWPATYFAGVFVLTLAVAALVVRLVEEPAVALGKNLARRIGPTSDRVAA